MELIMSLVDFIMHVDVHLAEIINVYGIWAYLVLFMIIFSETGFVVTPFLPGDSLLFKCPYNWYKPGQNYCFTSMLFVKYLSFAKIFFFNYAGVFQGKYLISKHSSLQPLQ